MKYVTTTDSRTGEGRLLTATEVDDNFQELRDGLDTLIANPPVGVGIRNITLNGTVMRIFLTDGKMLGPYTLPRSVLRYRGPWAPGLTYNANDIFKHEEWGVFLVEKTHFSAEPFIRSPTGGEYSLMIERQYTQGARVVTVSDTAVSPRLMRRADQGKYFRVSRTSPIEFQILPDVDAGVVYVGNEFHFRQHVTMVEPITFVALAGATLNVPVGFQAKLAGPGAVATIKKVAQNEYDLFGHLAEVELAP